MTSIIFQGGKLIPLALRIKFLSHSWSWSKTIQTFTWHNYFPVVFQQSQTLSWHLFTFFSLLFNDLLTSIPSRNKDKTCSPSSFSQFGSCRIVADCTDIEVATPSLMKDQNAVYSSFHCFNSVKVIVGVAPNAVITYVRKLYPDSISDKKNCRKIRFITISCSRWFNISWQGFPN